MIGVRKGLHTYGHAVGLKHKKGRIGRKAGIRQPPPARSLPTWPWKARPGPQNSLSVSGCRWSAPPSAAPACAGADAWPGERVWREPGAWVPPPRLALARSITSSASWVSSGRLWSSNDSMCGSRRGPLYPDGGPAAPDGHDDPQDLGRTGLLLGVASTLRLLFGLLVGVLLIGSRGFRVVRRIAEEAVAAASTTTIGAKGFCPVAAANPPTAMAVNTAPIPTTTANHAPRPMRRKG